jgi:hypothetical protein
MNRIQHTVMNLLHLLLLLLLLLLCLPRHFLLHSKTDRETDRETDDLSVKKKKTKANPRTIRTRLCLSFCACQTMFERHTKTQQQGFPVCLSVCLSVCLFVCQPETIHTPKKDKTQQEYHFWQKNA